MLIDLHMNPSPQGGFIVAQDRSFLKPRRVWKVWNLPDCFLRARESVRRASGFVQTGFWEVGEPFHATQLSISN